MDSGGNVDTHTGDTVHKDNFDTARGNNPMFFILLLVSSPVTAGVGFKVISSVLPFSILLSSAWAEEQEPLAGHFTKQKMGRAFFLAYSPFWITILLGVIVPLRLYERFQEVEYLLLGLLTAAPCIVFPFFLVCAEDAKKPFYRRYWFKANLWVGIFGYVGNYFWTHYFYVVLGATYTFPSYKINHVPITTFLLTQPYFLLYHTISNMTLRRLGHAIRNVPGRCTRWLIQAVWIVLLSYITALTEAVTISNFPYYEMVDRMAMYKIGSLFYACYFIVSFPMFMRLDENVSAPWTLTQVTVDALGASMLVTIILDLWRITLGPIVDIPWAASHNDCVQFGPPWLRSTSEVQGIKHNSWAQPATKDASCEDLSASTGGESYFSDEL